jgi:uncharacterized protein HemX
MDNETQKEQNNMNSTEMENPRLKKDGGVGPTIGSVIIILIIILGGLYFLDTIRQRQAEKLPVNETSDTEDISAELEATDVESLDEELAEIEAEIEASLEE